MRTALFIATLLLALPALAADPAMPTPPPPADTKIEAPPSPPPVTWEVWGYKWDNGGWVKQSDHCLKTTDLKAGHRLLSGNPAIPKLDHAGQSARCLHP